MLNKKRTTEDQRFLAYLASKDPEKCLETITRYEIGKTVRTLIVCGTVVFAGSTDALADIITALSQL